MNRSGLTFSSVGMGIITLAVMLGGTAMLGGSPGIHFQHVAYGDEGEDAVVYALRLTAEPRAPVRVLLQPQAGVEVSPPEIIFTAENWSDLHGVALRIGENGAHDGYRSTIVTHILVSEDPDFKGEWSYAVGVIDDVGPTALPDEYTTEPDMPVIILPTENDISPTGVNLSFQLLPETANGGTVVESGEAVVTYTPPRGRTEIDDSFRYHIEDTDGRDIGRVTIHIKTAASGASLSSVAYEETIVAPPPFSPRGGE